MQILFSTFLVVQTTPWILMHPPEATFLTPRSRRLSSILILTGLPGYAVTDADVRKGGQLFSFSGRRFYSSVISALKLYPAALLRNTSEPESERFFLWEKHESLSCHFNSDRLCVKVCLRTVCNYHLKVYGSLFYLCDGYVQFSTSVSDSY